MASGYFIRLHQDGTCSIIAVCDNDTEEVQAAGLTREQAELELILVTGQARHEKTQLEFDF